jgi:hypothetical protein
LVEEAYRRGSLDDVTCVIVRFHHDAWMLLHLVI